MIFHITLSPVRMDETLSLSRSGNLLILNGAALDLSGLAEGDSRPAGDAGSPWLTGEIRRAADALHLTLILPHGPVPQPPPPGARAVTYPAPLTVTADGPVILPRWTQEDGPGPDSARPTDDGTGAAGQ